MIDNSMIGNPQVRRPFCFVCWLREQSKVDGWSDMLYENYLRNEMRGQLGFVRAIMSSDIFGANEIAPYLHRWIDGE